MYSILSETLSSVTVGQYSLLNKHQLVLHSVYTWIKALRQSGMTINVLSFKFILKIPRKLFPKKRFQLVKRTDCNKISFFSIIKAIV